MNFTDWVHFKKVMEMGGRRPTTVFDYIDVLKRVERYGVDLDDISSFNDKLARCELAQSTKYMAAAALKSYYKLQKKMQEANSIVSPTFKSREKERFLTPEEMDRMITVCETPELKLFMNILRDTGFRKGILMNLKPSMIDMKTGMVIIPPEIYGNKAKIRFKTWLKPEALTAVKDRIKDENISAEGKIFPFKWITAKYRVMMVTYYFRKTAKKAGIADWKHIGPHAFRHGFASDYRAHGGSMSSLSFVLGHKDERTTRRYSHREDELAIDEFKNVKGNEE